MKARVRLANGGGLYLEVTPNGSRPWFWKYRFSGKEKRLALGSYIEIGSRKVSVPLRDARGACDDARKLLRKGTDPTQQRLLDKLNRLACASAWPAPLKAAAMRKARENTILPSG